MDTMFRSTSLVIVICIAASLHTVSLRAEEAASPRGLTEIAAYRLESHLGHRTVLLAEAIPAESYEWRPAEGVRSVAEIFKHVASSYHWFGVQLGADKPADLPNWDEVESKQEILDALASSLDFARRAISSQTEAELAREIDFFGRPTTQRELVLNLMTHGSEHLGQAIAYARSLGVEPPWSDG